MAIGFVAMAVAGILIFANFSERRKQWMQEDAADKAFQQHRAERQAEFDRHAIELAHWCLMKDASKIHFAGENDHE